MTSTSISGVVLEPQPSNDPKDPSSRRRSKKLIILATLCLAGLRHRLVIGRLGRSPARSEDLWEDTHGGRMDSTQLALSIECR